MASIRALPSGKLYIDFRYLEERFRETTLMDDSPANRKRLEAIARKMEAEMLLGSFSYAKYFPKSKSLAKVQLLEARSHIGTLGKDIPTFAEMTAHWLSEHEVEWREHYRATITNLIHKHVLPELGEIPLDAISRDVLVAFRNGRVKCKPPLKLDISF